MQLPLKRDISPDVEFLISFNFVDVGGDRQIRLSAWKPVAPTLRCETSLRKKLQFTVFVLVVVGERTN